MYLFQYIDELNDYEKEEIMQIHIDELNYYENDEIIHVEELNDHENEEIIHVDELNDHENEEINNTTNKITFIKSIINWISHNNDRNNTTTDYVNVK